MQSGKTGSIKYLCQTVLTSLGYLKLSETVCFTTSMREKDLYNQNKTALENYSSNIIVSKMDRLRAFGLVDMEYNNYALFVRDEDQYGCGNQSTFDFSFFKNIRKIYPEIPLVMVSATPYDIMDAENHGFDVFVVKGKRSEKYFGITEMLEAGLVEDLPEKYQHISADNKGGSTISKQIKSGCLMLKRSERGIGIIRCGKTKEALRLKEQLRTFKEKFEIETLIIGCRSDCDMPIQEGLSRLGNLVERQNKKIILLVMNALSAGKDLKQIKNHVKFVIETKKRQLANIVQGLPGRLCGYHTNRQIKIFSCKNVLEHYSEFENNPSVIKEDLWINNLYYDEKIKSLSTQTKLESQIRSGQYREVRQIKKYSIEDLFRTDIEEEIGFLSSESIKKIISYFNESFYNQRTRTSYVTNPKERVYVSTYSSFKTKTFKKNWKSKKKDNMIKIFPRISDDCSYGILVANYPLGHPQNEVGFCGIKIIKCGKRKRLKRLSTTSNYSMYECNEKN